MVGTGRFELPTPRTPSECSTRLSHVPTQSSRLGGAGFGVLISLHQPGLVCLRPPSESPRASHRPAATSSRRGANPHCTPASASPRPPLSMRRRNEFLRQRRACTEEKLLHLLHQELLCLRSPGLQPVLVQQHLLPVHPLAPGCL